MRLVHPDNPALVVEAADDTHAQRYLTQGWRQVNPDTPAPTAPVKQWRAYALEQGLDPAMVKTATRDELRAACI